MSHEKLLKKLPEGWKVAYLLGRVIAIHPNYTPRHVIIEAALDIPFDQWGELELYES